MKTIATMFDKVLRKSAEEIAKAMKLEFKAVKKYFR